MNPALAIRRKCQNTLVYLVVQQKYGSILNDNDADHTTIKYQPLFSDGLRSRNDTSNGGDLEIYFPDENITESYRSGQTSHISGNDFIWSPSEDIPKLRTLLSETTAPKNTYFVSTLTNIRSSHGFAHLPNRGSTKIITVHVLLNFYSFRSETAIISQNLTNVGDILISNADQTLIDGLKEYENQVIQACSA